MLTSDLSIGLPAPSDLYDDNGSLLIPRGSLVTNLLVGKLTRNGIHTLYTDPRGGSASPAAVAAPPDQRRESVDPHTQKIRLQVDKVMRSYHPEKVLRIDGLFRHTSQLVDQLTTDVIQHGAIDPRTATPIVEAVLDELTDDADPVVAGNLVRQADLDLARRCVQFSTLALAVGSRMRLQAKELQDLGRAALTHDWSLMELPADQRFQQQRRDPATQTLFRNHPLRSEMLATAGNDGSSLLPLLVSQVHELLDGTGFPRRLAGESIHPLSRILAVVDTYLTLTSPPTGFPRIVPSDAIAYIVGGMSDGKYAPTAVSGLLETVSLYPLGSVVELNDASKVRAIKTNGADYGYPIVEDVEHPMRQLSLRGSKLFVTRPIPLAEFGEARLPENYMSLRSS